MYSPSSSINGQKDVRVQGQSSDLANRPNFGMSSLPKNLKGNDTINDSQDPEAMELYSRAKAQQEEILYLREQIALASVRESQLLNEKYGLEKKFSELRMALDEKQNEAIISASNELTRRKGDLEENLRLVNELKDTEDDKYIFTSSMLGLLAEYGVFPRVASASSLANNVKHLHDQLEMKIRTSHVRLKYVITYHEVIPILMQWQVMIDGKVRTDRTYLVDFVDVVSIPKTNVNFRLPYDTKRLFHLHSLRDKQAKFKLCKV
uniref:Small ribosomal subunit protein eS4 central region domain-containing protein n=1 Tax=Solanum tuberosum TaxID=4113 RepID=M1B768_SOLTU